jgi:hypothetical protein
LLVFTEVDWLCCVLQVEFLEGEGHFDAVWGAIEAIQSDVVFHSCLLSCAEPRGE